MSTIIPQAGTVTILLSAEREYRTDRANAKFHTMLLAMANDRLEAGELTNVQECDGAYKGIPEQSIAITGPTVDALTIGRMLGHAFIQESVLVVLCDGTGALQFMSGDDPVALGEYQACDPGTTDAWTRVKATGETFTFT